MQLFFASCSLSMTVLRKESLYKTDGLPMGKRVLVFGRLSLSEISAEVFKNYGDQQDIRNL